MLDLFAERGLLSTTKWIAWSLVAVACAGETANPDVCQPGNEGCDCYGNDSCNAQLTCASHLCVNLTTSSSGGATAMGGGSTNSGGAPLSGGNESTGGTTGTVAITGGTAAYGGSAAYGGALLAGGTAFTGGTVTTGGMPTTGGAHTGVGAVTGGSTSCLTGTVGCPCFSSGLCSSGLTCGSLKICCAATGCEVQDSGTGGSGSQATDCSSQLGETLTQCSNMQVEPLAATANVLLVLDASGSMRSLASATDTSSKWSSLASALAVTLGNAPNSLHFGLEMFPYDPNGPIDGNNISPAVTCQVPSGDPAIAVEISSSATNTQSINSIVGGFSPMGGTPTAEALRQAYSYFTAGNGSSLVGPKWVVLVTDGGANCNMNLTCDSSTCTQNIDCKCGSSSCTTVLNCCESTGSNSYGYICLDDTATNLAIDQLTSAGIYTFVVGLPGSERYADVLDSFALAGGVPNTDGPSYYAVASSSGQAGIEYALQSILARLGSSCDIALTTVPSNLEQVNVAVDCAIIPQSTSGDASVNWSIDTALSPARLRLGTAACDAAVHASSAGVQVVTGCPTLTGN